MGSGSGRGGGGSTDGACMPAHSKAAGNACLAPAAQPSASLVLCLPQTHLAARCSRGQGRGGRWGRCRAPALMSIGRRIDLHICIAGFPGKGAARCWQCTPKQDAHFLPRLPSQVVLPRVLHIPPTRRSLSRLDSGRKLSRSRSPASASSSLSNAPCATPAGASRQASTCSRHAGCK